MAHGFSLAIAETVGLQCSRGNPAAYPRAYTMRTYTADAITATVESCPDRRTAIAWVRAEADALIEQADRRARGFDKGQWRDDCNPGDRNRANRIATVSHTSAEAAFALARRFAKGGR